MLKIVFFATPQIAIQAFQYLLKMDDIEICALVTKMDKPKGRGQKIDFSPMKVIAQEYSIEVIQPRLLRTDVEAIEKLKLIKPDFFITFAYGQILSQEILDIPKHGTINLHASLLPKYRGANPIQCAIVNGEQITGVSTMLTVQELDAGDICLTKEICITPNMTDIELSALIAKTAPAVIYTTIKKLEKKELVPIVQDHKEATFACKFSKADGCIDWNKSAVAIHNTIRGLCSWPCCYSFFNGKMIKLTKSVLSIKKTQALAGSYLGKSSEGLDFATGTGDVLTIVRVKPEGKSEMPAKDWINGAKMQIGDKFTCDKNEGT